MGRERTSRNGGRGPKWGRRENNGGEWKKNREGKSRRDRGGRRDDVRIGRRNENI